MKDKDFPKHNGGLAIYHNQHKDEYKTIEQYVKDIQEIHADEKEENEEVLEKCIANNSIWEMHVYPDTPIGSYTIYSDTFEGLFGNNKICPMEKIVEEKILGHIEKLEEIAKRQSELVNSIVPAEIAEYERIGKEMVIVFHQMNLLKMTFKLEG